MEIKLRRRIDAVVDSYLRTAIEDKDIAIEDFAKQAFTDIEIQALEIVTNSLSEIISQIDDINCVAYGVKPELVEQYLLSRDSVKP